MDVVVTYDGVTRTVAIHGDEVLIGRKSSNNEPDLDLSPDKSVSRRHAKLWLDHGKYWIEDAVNGLKRPKSQITFGDLIDIGRTRLQLLPTRVNDLVSG
jgi:predicted component of type VI protein secretion system